VEAAPASVVHPGFARRNLAALGNVLPDLAFAAIFLVAWISPGTLGDQIVRRLFLLLLMEFIVLQATGLMGTVTIQIANRAVRGTAILAFAAFYTVFAGAISIAMSSWLPLLGFWALTLNRLLGVLLRQVPDEETRSFVARGWLAGTSYFLSGFLLVTVLPIPPLGLTRTYALAHPIIGAVPWVAEPQRVMAFGAFYYLLTGWSGWADHRWTDRFHRFGASAGESGTKLPDDEAV
jgi:hypothetical protein